MEAESTAGIPNRTVNSLEDRHIIRGEARSGGTWYELTHDRFIQPILASDEKWRARRRKRIGWAIVVSSLLLALSLVGFFFHKHQQRNKVIEYFKEMYVVQDLPGQYSLSAWEALGQGDYRRAIEVAEQCTQVLGEQADREQQRLAKSGLQAPPVGVPTMDEALKIAARRPLNTVAGCYLIRGDAAERLQRRDEAREAWLAAAKYTYARSWNPRGFFWSPSQAALERLLR
jgi:tetratricopeptide (TPR) repeat protein